MLKMQWVRVLSTIMIVDSQKGMTTYYQNVEENHNLNNLISFSGDQICWRKIYADKYLNQQRQTIFVDGFRILNTP